MNWVKFTGEGEQNFSTEVLPLARIRGVAVDYKIVQDHETADVLIIAKPDGPVGFPGMFGGRFKGPAAYLAALSLVMADISVDYANEM